VTGGRGFPALVHFEGKPESEVIDLFGPPTVGQHLDADLPEEWIVVFVKEPDEGELAGKTYERKVWVERSFTD
jgi:hypothetical protein